MIETKTLIRNKKFIPYYCDKCEFLSADVFCMQSHRMKNHESKTSPVAISISKTINKPFKCPQCEKYFKTQSKLKYHQQYHSESKPFTCKQSQKTLL